MTILFIQDTLINGKVYGVGDIYNLGATAEATQIAAFTAVTYPTYSIGSQAPTITLPSPNLTAAGIQSAINAMGAAGGGTVQLPSGPILLSTSLNPVPGVKLRGIPPQMAYTSIPDANVNTFSGAGTVLTPTGAFPAITWNTTVLGTPASQAIFAQGGLTNIAFEDLGFSGGTYGIFAGATNSASCWWSQFKNLYFIGQTVIGLSLTNYQHCQFFGNYSFNCAWGQYHGIDVASASLAPGNSTYYDLYNVNSSSLGNLSRSITFLTTAALAAAADNNQFMMNRIQSNRFSGSTVTQAATMANTQANITITDGTKFAVGMPVTVDATQNGFTIKKIYFVISVVSNIIQLSLTYGGAAISATGAVAVNVVTQGFPCFEMIALSGSAQTNIVIDNIDVEGVSTAAMVFQNCNGVHLRVSQVPGTSQATQSVCFRGCQNKNILSPQSVSKDDDQNAVGSASSFIGAAFGTWVGYPGMGLWYDSVSGKSVFSMGYQNDTQSAGLLTFDPATSGGLVTPKNAGIGHFIKNVNSASFAVNSLNCTISNGTASGVTNTLPTVVAANAGSWLIFINHTASAQTISTDGTQLFNGVALRTAITLNAGATVCLEAVQSTTGPAYTWDVTGGTSAMVAGVISAPT